MTAPPNFNRLAGLYRWMEWLTFGPLLQKCRVCFLAAAAGSRRALILGDGDGRFTARLLAANPLIEIDAIDASPAMLRALARRAGPDSARVHTHCADARLLRPSDAAYDLVISHFFLDCLSTEEIHALATALRSSISPTAQWMVSEFNAPRNWFGRLIARPLISALYRAFGLLTGLAIRQLPDHSAALRASGFTIAHRRTRLAGLLISELWFPNETEQPQT
jgi:ubiquinone/menaquinone biosynthesis C-methylase UbiE